MLKEKIIETIKEEVEKERRKKTGGNAKG